MCERRSGVELEQTAEGWAVRYAGSLLSRHVAREAAVAAARLAAARIGESIWSRPETDRFGNDRRQPRTCCSDRCPPRDEEEAPLVLVCHNEQADGQDLIARLCARGYEVCKAPIPSGARALADYGTMLVRYKPAAVVLDLSPPFGPALELLRQVRRNRLLMTAPLVVTTNRGSHLEAIVAPDEGRAVLVSQPTADPVDVLEAILQ